MPLHKIVIASGNRHKFEEFRDLLAPLGITLLFGKELVNLEVDETGSTFLENASLKATEWASRTGYPALADDSGIEVEQLDWRPGIYSARVGQDDQDCRDWLVRNIDKEKSKRARYTAALVLATPEGEVLWSTVQHCWGDLVTRARGVNGFGYDPLFIPEGYNKTFGELSPEIKSKISHRAKAAKEFIKWLASAKNMVQ